MPAPLKSDNPLAPTSWALALLMVVAAAKVALLALRGVDGAGVSPVNPWLFMALLHEDLRLVAAFAVLVGGAELLVRRRPPLARVLRAAVTALYAGLTFWTVFNVPVARQLSSPLTYALLHATGGALSDSIAGYVTPLNLGLPIALWVAALLLPRFLRARVHPSRRAVGIAAAVAAAWIALGPAAVAHTDLSGWHRNAVLTLLETTLGRGAAGDGTALPSLASAACLPTDRPATADLSDLAGLARGRNIVWVILESTGARALPAYGAARDVTPQLSALAAQSVVFDNAYAAYPESIKGLFSILCARSPPPHAEASEFGAARVPCRAAAQELAGAGYRTGLFHSGWFAYLGMEAVVKQRGFDQLVDAGGIDSPHRSSFGVDDRSTARRLLAFVDAQPVGQKFFAVFMPIAGHHPYRAPGDAPRPLPEAGDHDAYLNDLHVADDAFGVVRDGLRARGLDQKTIYVVVGDHGEAFREHPGNVAHALFIYEENVRVPFFIAAPGAMDRQRRAPQLASLIDLTPTTLALAGLAPPGAYEGRSLLAGAPPRVTRFFTEQGVRRWGLRDGRWKLILDADSDRAQLFDLQADPGERENRAAAQPERVRRYFGCLGR
jgi:lipoteichoic acid synthase